MIKIFKKTICLAAACALVMTTFAQLSTTEYRKKISFTIDSTHTANILAILQNKNKTTLFDDIRTLLTSNAASFANVDGISSALSAANDGSYKRINEGENSAMVLMFRDMQLDVVTQLGNKAKIDYESQNIVVFHKRKMYDKGTKKDVVQWTDYLLGTRDVFFVYIDFDDKYYIGSGDEEKQLSNSEETIVYHTSFLKKSFQDLKTIITGSMSGGGATGTPGIKITIVKYNAKRVDSPCDLVIKNKSFKENVEVEIHDRNFASFQTGVINDKYTVSNVSLSGGNLVIKPNDDQKEEWKSNLYAAFEFHPFGYNNAWGRDIDNFKPFWKDVFLDKNADRVGFARWLKHVTLSRIGVYGGLKISKDPLSSLHAGFNYALTKDVYLNVGWSWINEVIPQVKEIGDISSVNDAIKYANRKYSDGKFSWGLSFAPGSLMEMLGLKGKEKEKTK
jgi:hypothetical protein